MRLAIGQTTVGFCLMLRAVAAAGRCGLWHLACMILSTCCLVIAVIHESYALFAVDLCSLPLPTELFRSAVHGTLGPPLLHGLVDPVTWCCRESRSRTAVWGADLTGSCDGQGAWTAGRDEGWKSRGRDADLLYSDENATEDAIEVLTDWGRLYSLCACSRCESLQRVNTKITNQIISN